MYFKNNHNIGIPSTQKLLKYFDCSASDFNTNPINRMAMPKTKKKFEEKEWCNSKKTKRNNNRPPNHRVVLIPSIWGQVDSLGSSNFMSLISKGRVATNTKMYR